ncbi:MAG: biotin--[acetyl-CoA-carboxylase] ligase [Cyclobacteriaceae bacterium]|nr:biotin--[acetyl-CoA-carboxylase] ligase [Cyclobacteriaceae bacterium]
MGQKLVYVPECHSTSSFLNELNNQSQLPEGTVIITDHQTAGRGQRGNVWEAEAGKNLMFSFLLRPSFLPPAAQFNLNMCISLAVAAVMQQEVPQSVRLKWPNDIFVNDKKIGGILIENQIQANTITASCVGIGLNVNQERFSHPRAASLHNFSQLTHDRSEVFEQLLKKLEDEYLKLRAGATDLKQRYLKILYKHQTSGRFASAEGEFTGTISDVDDHGRLCVEVHGAMRRYLFKEITFLE